MVVAFNILLKLQRFVIEIEITFEIYSMVRANTENFQQSILLYGENHKAIQALYACYSARYHCKRQKSSQTYSA